MEINQFKGSQQMATFLLFLHSLKWQINPVRIQIFTSWFTLQLLNQVKIIKRIPPSSMLKTKKKHDIQNNAQK